MMRTQNELIAEYANQAWQALYVGLNNYGVKYGADYTKVGVHNSVMILSFSFAMRNTSTWKKLYAIKTELSQMLQLEDDGGIRLGFTGLDYRIEVPKAKSLHSKVSLNDVLGFSKGLEVGVGVSVVKNRPETIDFSRNTSGHLLVSGSTRCGKTNVIKIIIKALLKNNSPDDLRILVIDIVKAKGKYGALANSAHLAAPVIDSEDKAVNALKWAKSLINKRGGISEGRRKIMIIVDEAARFIREETYDLLSYVASAGAESGVHIIAASQYTNKENIGSREFKGNLTQRICGRVDDGKSSANATGRKGAGAESLMVPGDFLSVSGDGVARIATPEIMDTDFRGIPRGLIPMLKLNQPNEEQSSAVTSMTPSVKKCFESIDEKLLWLALVGKNQRTGKPLGADAIRKMSSKLGNSIGQGAANEYVKLAKRVIDVRDKNKQKRG